MKIETSCRAGFTLVEIMIVVAIIGLLAAITIPNFLRSRAQSQMNTCISNLRQIDGAKQRWAMESGKTGTDTPTAADILPYIGRGGGVLPSCPLSGQPSGDAGFAASYQMGDVSTAPQCILNGTGQADPNFPHHLD